MDVDARALFKAAGSLNRLTLKVHRSCSSKALADIFEHRPLEELDISLESAVEVSSWGKQNKPLCKS